MRYLSLACTQHFSIVLLNALSNIVPCAAQLSLKHSSQHHSIAEIISTIHQHWRPPFEAVLKPNTLNLLQDQTMQKKPCRIVLLRKSASPPWTCAICRPPGSQTHQLTSTSSYLAWENALVLPLCAFYGWSMKCQLATREARSFRCVKGKLHARLRGSAAAGFGSGCPSPGRSVGRLRPAAFPLPVFATTPLRLSTCAE